MKSQLPYLLLVLGFAGGVALLQPGASTAQTDDPAFAALLTELAAQQATLQDNQTKIDAKLAAIGEDVRQARLFAARGGAK